MLTNEVDLLNERKELHRRRPETVFPHPCGSTSTNERRQLKTNSRRASQIGRQMHCQTSRKIESNHAYIPTLTLGKSWTHLKKEIARTENSTSELGYDLRGMKKTQMNWREPKSRTLPARLGDKCIAIRGSQ